MADAPKKRGRPANPATAATKRPRSPAAEFQRARKAVLRSLMSTDEGVKIYWAQRDRFHAPR